MNQISDGRDKTDDFPIPVKLSMKKCSFQVFFKESNYLLRSRNGFQNQADLIFVELYGIPEKWGRQIAAGNFWKFSHTFWIGKNQNSDRELMPKSCKKLTLLGLKSFRNWKFASGISSFLPFPGTALDANTLHGSTFGWEKTQWD